jgi:hypothetical protein
MRSAARGAFSVSEIGSIAITRTAPFDYPMATTVAFARATRQVCDLSEARGAQITFKLGLSAPVIAADFLRHSRAFPTAFAALWLPA